MSKRRSPPRPKRRPTLEQLMWPKRAMPAAPRNLLPTSMLLSQVRRYRNSQVRWHRPMTIRQAKHEY
ncbi:hypothetical protein [Mesorhizobium sp. LNJC391B00]|uniref:hypothetical protein n=1 Tax=Mesorhizobium sp. LNJC391B00 TaxID=1287273 RepID=UPI0012EC241D|nr:hypothetical protein [Mesorhizobium sp. LNJC391B00]